MHPAAYSWVWCNINTLTIAQARPTMLWISLVLLLPRVHAQGVKQSSVVVVVGTKIARSRVLGVCACCKHNQSVDIGEKLVCMCFELLNKAYWCYKSWIFCSTCLWFIDHIHSFSMLMQLRMLKLSVRKGRQAIKQLCHRSECCSTRARYVLYRALVSFLRVYIRCQCF